MTQEKDKPTVVNKLVVSLDICSSSHLIEDLLKTDNIKVWRDLLLRMKQYLVNQSRKYNAIVYKFMGDGWILLFAHPYSGKEIFAFLSHIYDEFGQIYSNGICGYLDSPPAMHGLKFGMDEGPLIRVQMQARHEYIGRPINVACRLQGIIDEVDIKGGYRG